MTATNLNSTNSGATDKLLIKVCGMREQENITELVSLNPDLIGFIFYPKSARFAGDVINPEYLQQLPISVQKVGVFVNESFERIIEITGQYQLQAVQLHGEESPELCKQLLEAGLTVLKAFALDDNFNFYNLIPYEGSCHFFLFDTKGQQYGGNGTTFNWSILDNYTGSTPFFLSGGLDLEHAPAIKAGRWPLLRGIDINSRFELKPGLKNIPKVTQMITAFRT